MTVSSLQIGQAEIVAITLRSYYWSVNYSLVLVDWERLQGGDFYNEALTLALCESVCMVVVFTPTYFDKEHIVTSK